MSASATTAPRFDWRAIALLGALVGGSILLRVPFLSVPMITDEGGYSYVARFWTPEYQLYRDIPFDRPQAIFFLYQLAYRLFGPDVTAIRLFAALYNAVTVVAMVLLCRRVFSARAGWLAGGLLALFSVAPRIEGFTANAELFMLLPLVVAAYLTWREQWFWAGFAGAMAVLLKPSGASALLLTLSWLLVARAKPSAWLRVGLGFAVGLSPSVLHGVWIGWQYYWESIHERRLMLYNAETVSLAAQWGALVQGVGLTVSSWAFLAVASVLAVMQPRARGIGFGALWLGFSVVGVAMGGWWREHYFIQLVPPLVFLASRGLSSLPTVSLRGAWVLALLLALALFVRRDLALAFQDPHAISWSVYQRPGYLLQNDIAAYVQAVTTPEDTIYVAFGEAELYYLSERRNAVAQFYVLHAQYSGRVFDSVVEAIAQRQPAVILLVQAPPPNQMSVREFLALVERGYARDRVFSVNPDAPPIIAYRRRVEAG